MLEWMFTNSLSGAFAVYVEKNSKLTVSLLSVHQQCTLSKLNMLIKTEELTKALQTNQV